MGGWKSMPMVIAIVGFKKIVKPILSNALHLDPISSKIKIEAYPAATSRRVRFSVTWWLWLCLLLHLGYRCRRGIGQRILTGLVLKVFVYRLRTALVHIIPQGHHAAGL